MTDCLSEKNHMTKFTVEQNHCSNWTYFWKLVVSIHLSFLAAIVSDKDTVFTKRSIVSSTKDMVHIEYAEIKGDPLSWYL